MPPGRRRHHGRARTALAILLAALPVIPLPLAAASAVPEAAASPWHETASAGYSTFDATVPPLSLSLSWRQATGFALEMGRLLSR